LKLVFFGTCIFNNPGDELADIKLVSLKNPTPAFRHGVGF